MNELDIFDLNHFSTCNSLSKTAYLIENMENFVHLTRIIYSQETVNFVEEQN